MSLEKLRRDVLAAADIQRALVELRARFVATDLLAKREDEAPDLDWNRLLLVASLLGGSTDEETTTAALRITQGCFISDEATDAHRVAAAVVLERMGNRHSVALAQRRDLLTDETDELTPIPLRLDVVRRRLELSIPGPGGRRLPVSPFQRRFWDLATENDWLSVSAPTSAGKSWIVMRWFEHRLTEIDRFRGFYIVPTRALVEEVSLDLTRNLKGDAIVHTIPWEPTIGEAEREIYVMTQERVHLLMRRLADLTADVIFVDEAQKFADDSRGVLLERALGDLVRRRRDTQVIFASPMSANPDLLVRDAPTAVRRHSEVVEAVTVNQTLLWADSTRGRPKHWRLRAPEATSETEVGTFELTLAPSRTSQRLPVVAYSLAGDSTGNVLYVNAAADAEKAAYQLFELLGPDADTDHEDIAALRELLATAVHPQYALIRSLSRGIAFHYGNMPLIVRAEIERLFREGAIRYLVCTSTLLEGVNLPCRNLFVRGPKRGRGNHMTSGDFWNLAGRAGRWGKEFQGNIVCVDVAQKNVWQQAPRTRSRTELRRATDSELVDARRLLTHARNEAPILPNDREQDLSEAMLSLLAVTVARGEPLAEVPGLRNATPETISGLEELLRDALDQRELPIDLVERHAGISPQAMNRLLERFDSEPTSALIVEPPGEPDALGTYHGALGLCADELGAPFGEDKRQWQLAYLITDWMRGRPLRYLISQRLKLNQAGGKQRGTDAIIRETMADVETVARFQAPKFLACYLDLLRLHLERVFEPELAGNVPDLDMLLELGVSQPTQMVLLGMGLSRTTAIAVTEYFLGEDRTREEWIAWLRATDLDSLSVPRLVRHELDAARKRYAVA